MSYARRLDGSSVYVYGEAGGDIVCDTCNIASEGTVSGANFRCSTIGGMIDHLMEHQEIGDNVDCAIKSLLQEQRG